MMSAAGNNDADVFVPVASKYPLWAEMLTKELSREIVGQSIAIRRLVRTIVIFSAGIAHPRRPPQPFFFVGPSGSGKTFTAETIARLWLGASEKDNEMEGPLVKLSGENFEQEHEGTVFRGAPPGYIGHDKGTPLEDIGLFDAHKRMQDVEERIQEWWERATRLIPELLGRMFAGFRITEENAAMLRDRILPQIFEILNSKIEELKERFRQERGPFRSVLLVDEFERMHRSNQEQFLTILDRGTFVTHAGRLIDLRGTLIIFTSNIGTDKISNILQGGNSLGFHLPVHADDKIAQDNQKIYTVVEQEVRKRMIPAMYSRIGKEGIVELKEKNSC